MDVWKAVCAFVALLRKERKELPDDPERKKELFDRIEHGQAVQINKGIKEIYRFTGIR